MLDEYKTFTDNPILEFVFLPWNIITQQLRFGSGFDVLGGFGWAMYIFSLPTILFVQINTTIKRIIIPYLLIYLVCWFLTRQVLRFLVPVLPFLSYVVTE